MTLGLRMMWSVLAKSMKTESQDILCRPDKVLWSCSSHGSNVERAKKQIWQTLVLTYGDCARQNAFYIWKVGIRRIDGYRH